MWKGTIDMEILIILGIIYYAILLLKQCNKTPGEILAIIQNPEKHRIARMCLRGIINGVGVFGLSEPAQAWAEGQMEKGSISPCLNFADIVSECVIPDATSSERFFNAAKRLTEADLKTMMESVP